jgi:hypothetical protein
MDDRREKIAAFVSLVPIVYGVGFAVYAFAFDSITHTVISSDGESVRRESIAEAGDGTGVLLALAPLALAMFVSVLLYLARKDRDAAPLWMAWAFSGFIALIGLVAVQSIGRYFVLPALLMLLATGFTDRIVRSA